METKGFGLLPAAQATEEPEMLTNINTKGQRIKLSKPLALQRQQDEQVIAKASKILSKVSSRTGMQ